MAVLLVSPVAARAAVSDGSCQEPDRGTLGGLLSSLKSVFAAAKEEAGDVRDGALNGGGRALGVLEIFGARLGWHASVKKPYQSKVSDALWRGSRPGPAGIADLHARGFRGIVDLTAEGTDDSGVATALGMSAKRIKIIDNTAPHESQMVAFLDYVTNPANQPVYVHCEQGVGRTGVAVAVYRMAVQGWTPDAALAEAEADGLQMPAQEDFIRKFGADLAAAKIPGYPLQP